MQTLPVCVLVSLFGLCVLCFVLYTFVMSRIRLLRILALLVCAIAVLHIAAIVFSLYWTFWWYDMPLHLLGGIFIGLFVLWLRFFSGYFGAPGIPSGARVFCFVVIATLVIGIGWEVFEYLWGHTWSVEGYWLDTSTDVAFDLVGGLIAFGYFKCKYLDHA